MSLFAVWGWGAVGRGCDRQLKEIANNRIAEFFNVCMLNVTIYHSFAVLVSYRMAMLSDASTSRGQFLRGRSLAQSWQVSPLIVKK